MWVPNAIVTDARIIEAYYRTRYGRRSYFIPYGADTECVSSTGALDRLGLQPQGYLLYVSRMEPENNAHLVVKAFEQIQTDKKLVMVGDAPYAPQYIRQVRATADPRILFPGAIYGLGYRELQSHALCYIHATEVGGTHPALIEAMGCGRCVLYLNTAENREVAGDAAIAFSRSPEALAQKMRAALEDVGLRTDCERRAVERVRRYYQWDDVTAQYERLFEKLKGKVSQNPPLPPGGQQ
jgi:glycosyltransferase involved in cell wall biosynthesis